MADQDATTTTTTTTEYTLKDVAVHKSRTDAWMVINAEVFNVTDYIDDHPGGADLLLETAGTNATDAFDSAGHSDDALEILAQYRVGKLKGAKAAAPKAVRPPPVVRAPATSSSNSNSGSGSAIVKSTVLGLGALGSLFLVARQSRHVAQWQHIVNFPVLWPRSSKLMGDNGFAKGFLLASTISAVFASFAARTLLRIVTVESGIAGYPTRLKMPRTAKSNILSQRGFLHPKTLQSLPLTEKELVAPNVYRLVFALPTPQTILGLPTGQHVAIKATIDGQSVTRSYTPISNNADRGLLELLVKCYPDGLLTGKYLAKLEVGDEVEFRGPKGAMQYRRGLCNKIAMVAGGTGITPMFQLIRAICEDDRDTTEISLIYANRTVDDILLRAELDSFARRYPKNLTVYYMLNEAPAQWEYGVGYVNGQIMEQRLPAASPDTKAMLCGPPGMVTAATKALVELGFEKPGTVGRMTDQIFCF